MLAKEKSTAAVDALLENLSLIYGDEKLHGFIGPYHEVVLQGKKTYVRD